jgi:hypothetical protein
LGEHPGDTRRQENDNDRRHEEDRQAEDHRREGAGVSEPHRPFRVHQPAGSGATDTSYAFEQSLQAALLAAKKV